MSTAPLTPPPLAPVGPGPADPPLIESQRTALHEVIGLVAERAAAEAETETTFATNDAAADREYEKAKQTLAEKVRELRESSRKADEERRRAIVDAAIAGEAKAKADFARFSRRIASEFDAVRENAKRDLQRERTEALSAFDAAERAAAAEFAAAKRPIDDAIGIVEGMEDRLAALFDDYKKFGLADPPTTPTRETYAKFDDPTGQLFDRLTKLDKPLGLLEILVIPKAMKGSRPIWLFVVMVLLLAIPLGYVGEVVGAAGGAVAGIALGFVLRKSLYGLAKKQVSQYYYPLHQSLVDARALAAHCTAQAEERFRVARERNVKRRDDDLQKAKDKHAATLAAGEASRDEQLRKINESYAREMVDIQTRQQVDMRAAVEAYEKRQAELGPYVESNEQKLDEKYRAYKEKLRSRREASWNALATRWREGMGRAREVLDEAAREVRELGPEWDDPSWDDRPPPDALPPVVRFGELRVDLDGLPGGLPADPRLREGIPEGFTIPAVRAFPGRANLVVEAPAAGRAAAIGVLQAAMLRLLTSLPPGRVKFTILDPLGLGRNFGAFMHLADFDESLVTGQIWTDPADINDRLGELCAHMERVTQKYLRNEYASIEEYNAVAGEVAEPYRVLVVADFPANLQDKAPARLASLATAGIPCGILTLIAVDRDRPLPEGCSLDELRSNAACLAWEDGRLAWDDPDFGRYPLALDPLPPADLTTRLISRAGAAAQKAKRVEVPFEFIAPPADAWWTLDSRAGIDVPLGKAGATKRQNLTLGQGTSQHVLIAGRTGSGKSTLMHALICNLALNYSPDQLELYLIDFKKGVEFKVYATHTLPHASVVAIESEREFGISVLQRLDAEMRERGERFRDAGVQDLNGYRKAPGTPPLPRTLLIVDEFQEFFVEEDKLAQEAALLLDRLVRQGRAFGVHILLGSQSLGGAYALARSTLGQMAVRIALQCSEGDAHLILSESNTAAQLLSRPGEAIYNNANGQEEGNHFFQVVWLSDERRESYLKQLHDLARERPPALARTPIVFEGDAPADLAQNPLLTARLDAPAWPASPRSAHAWLGDPVAIKDPTSALFRRRGGNHLLIVGQNTEAALGIMAASLVGLAAQYPPPESAAGRGGARFAILDGTPDDVAQPETLARVAAVLPHPVELGGWNDSPRILAELAAEVERRRQPDANDGPEIFLIVHDIAQFRELRKRADDFGFGRRDEEAGPADHLATIVREGSARGVHLLVWCDTLNNLNRTFDNQALREFEMRVLFQMSPNDSGHLLDSPAASKLGPHRAYFSSEEQNRLEKFRPYGLPSDEWLARVKERFSGWNAHS